MPLSREKNEGQDKPGSGDTNAPFFAGREKEPTANKKKQETGGERSKQHDKATSTDSDRNSGRIAEKTDPVRTDESSFNLMVDSVPYLIKARPFLFNDEVRFYVNVNGGTDHVFTWDSELGRLRAIDDQSSIMPDALEEAISAKLEAKQK